jgi:hypothetical protein
VHHLFERNKAGIDMGQPGNLQTVGRPEEIISVESGIRFHRLVLVEVGQRLVVEIFRQEDAGDRRPKAIINVDPSNGQCYSGQVAYPVSGFIPMIISIY